MKTIYWFFAVFIFYFGFSSCKKASFEHQEAYIHYPCQICDLTDSVEGNYVGRYIKRVFYHAPLIGPTYDTLVDTIVSVQLVNIPMNEDFVIDSLYSKFAASGFINGEIYFSMDDYYMGRLKFNPRFYQDNYIDQNGNLILANTTYYSHNFSYTSAYFKGIKQ